MWYIFRRQIFKCLACAYIFVIPCHGFQGILLFRRQMPMMPRMWIHLFDHYWGDDVIGGFGPSWCILHPAWEPTWKVMGGKSTNQQGLLKVGPMKDMKVAPVLGLGSRINARFHALDFPICNMRLWNTNLFYSVFLLETSLTMVETAVLGRASPGGNHNYASRTACNKCTMALAEFFLLANNVDVSDITQKEVDVMNKSWAKETQISMGL